MKASEWAGASPLTVFDRLRLDSTARRLNLLGFGVCNLLAEHSPDPDLLQALDVFALHADNLTTSEAFLNARDLVWEFETQMQQGMNANGGDWLPDTLAFAFVGAFASAMNPNTHAGTARAIWFVTEGVTRAAPKGKKQTSQKDIRFRICDVIRELYQNPDHRFERSAAWAGHQITQPDQTIIPLTDTCLGLAEAIHLTGDFGRMPILADALEEAGVTDEILLKHCREAESHQRGCWVLDLVLGKD
ncbi:MAG: hypothetical protein ACRC8S_04170 [Fimbriiglobus sp.]